MNSIRISLALLLFCSGTLFAQAVTFNYLDPNSVNLPSILSGPPAQGSRGNLDDIRTVLAAQRARTPEQIARVRSEEELTPFAFADLLGSWFTPRNLPLTFALLKNAGQDAHNITIAGMKYWQRPRPPLQDPSIIPVIPLPQSASYPSYHATCGVLWAVILTQFAPDLRASFLDRGVQIGEHRVIAGVHFPTDVAAGQKLGRVIAARLLANPAFQHDLAAAQAEFSSVRPKSAEAFSKNSLIFTAVDF